MVYFLLILGLLHIYAIQINAIMLDPTTKEA